MEFSARHPIILQGAGFSINELAEGNGEFLPESYSNPITSLAERDENSARGIIPDTKLTAAEEAYFASRGADIRGIFEDAGRNVASDGTIGFVTFDGRILSGADYVNGFSRGDIVQLKTGLGPRMVVTDYGRSIYAGVRCQWFVGSELSVNDFQSIALKYLGPADSLPPERVVSINEHRESLIRRGNQAITAKYRRLKRRAA